jgi:hypothetical protein
MIKKNESFFIAITLVLSVMIMNNREAYPGNISINVQDGNAEITAMGGKSNVHVVSGCKEGSGIRKSEKRNVSSFNAVSFDGAFDVTIELQKKRGLEVTGDDNIIPHIITEVKGDTLHVTSDKSICSKIGLHVHITNEDIQKITADGSSDISLSNVKNRSLTVNINGAGDFTASGKTGTFAANISGAGNVSARDLHADEVDISIDGTGDAVVYSSEKLSASIDGAGDISYYGNPGEVNKKISGAGDIEKGD